MDGSDRNAQGSNLTRNGVVGSGRVQPLSVSVDCGAGDGQQGQGLRQSDSPRSSTGSVSSSSAGQGGRSYKEMTEQMKQVHNKTDAIAEEICALNSEFLVNFGILNAKKDQLA
jgi:hypothetical protein